MQPPSRGRADTDEIPGEQHAGASATLAALLLIRAVAASVAHVVGSARSGFDDACQVLLGATLPKWPGATPYPFYSWQATEARSRPRQVCRATPSNSTTKNPRTPQFSFSQLPAVPRDGFSANSKLRARQVASCVGLDATCPHFVYAIVPDLFGPGPHQGSRPLRLGGDAALLTGSRDLRPAQPVLTLAALPGPPGDLSRTNFECGKVSRASGGPAIKLR